MFDLRSYLRYLKSEKRYSAHTIQAYQNDLKQFSEFLSGTYELNDHLVVNHSHIRSWLVNLTEHKLEAKSIRRKVSALKSFYKFELKSGRIKVSPTAKLIVPKVKKMLPVFVNEKQMSEVAFETNEENSFSSKRDHLIFELLYNTGMRCSELVSLKDSSFDFYGRSLKVLGKGNKERIIPLSKELVEQLREYRKERVKKFDVSISFFVTDGGKSIYPRYVYRVVNKLLSELSTVEKKSPHVLRHTFATHMLNNGAEINAIKELLGHTSLAATQVYTHNTIEKLKDVYKKAHPKS